MLENVAALGLSGRGLLLKAVAYLSLLGLATFVYRLYHYRSMVRRVQKEHGIFIIPHSFLFGHLVTLAKLAIKKKMPADAHGQMVPLLIALEYPEVMKAGVVYMDVWPVQEPMIAVFDQDMMAQFTQEHNQQKHPRMFATFLPFTGGVDLVTTEGQEWKTDRSIFNPGFSAKNLLSMIPSFIEDALVFKRLLLESADGGNVVKLEHLTTSLTVDIIARAVIGAQLNAQEKSVKLMTAMLDQVALLAFSNDYWKLLHPLRPIRHWFYNKTFRDEVMPYVESTIHNYEKIEGPKTILNLAVKSYVNEVQDISARGNIPQAFLDKTINHIKMFLFAGHDTTASTLAYTYMLLSDNPDKAALLRQELDSVLGPDPSQAAERISRDPSLLNQLPFTLAVVKETLRLYPVVGTVRVGSKGFFLTHPTTGQRYPTEDFMIFGCSKASHRHPDVWPQPDDFIPERFTVRDENDPLHPPKNAFRPWEMGSRNCIGQELASLELRLILALTVRELEVEEAFEDGAPTFLGSKAYQVQPKDMVTAHAKGGMPVRIKRRI